MFNTESFRGGVAKQTVLSVAASAFLCCAFATPASAAAILTIELEAVFGQLGMGFDGDTPNSVDIVPGDILSFTATLTDLENTGVPSFRFAPTILDATASINGASFTFGNVRAFTNAFSGLDFDILGDSDFSDASDFELTGTGPLLEGAIFTKLSFFNQRTDVSSISSLADLIPSLRDDIINLSIFKAIAVTGPNSLRLSGGAIFGAEVTSFQFTLSDTEVVPLPGAFVLMAGGLALFGGLSVGKRRQFRKKVSD